jgi:hypothetical protein
MITKQQFTDAQTTKQQNTHTVHHTPHNLLYKNRKPQTTNRKEQRAKSKERTTSRDTTQHHAPKQHKTQNTKHTSSRQQ